MSDMHSTRSAARLLGVSEASVRRWSDAGMLPVERVGRRRTRRFSEADLRNFRIAESRGAAPTPAESRAEAESHDHFATFYGSDASRMRLSLPFLRDGLAAGDRCYLVASEPLAAEYMGALGEVSGNGSGDLVVRPGVGSSAREAIAGWQDEWLQALRTGHRAIRVVGEMASYAGFEDNQAMLDYEVAYDSLCKRFPVMTLCQYDVRSFDGRVMLGALQAHPDLFTRRISDFLF